MCSEVRGACAGEGGAPAHRHWQGCDKAVTLTCQERLGGIYTPLIKKEEKKKDTFYIFLLYWLLCLE